MKGLDRSSAEKALESEVVDVRLSAARYYALNAKQADLPILSKALLHETVPWIKRALQRAVASVTNYGTGPRPANTPASSEPSEALVRDIRAEAVEEVAGTILHEFAPIIGAIRLSAREEVAEFETSSTHRLLNQLSALVAAVRRLKRAAAVPSYTEFDLVELITSTIEALSPIPEGIEVRLAGQKPFLIQSDRDTMYLALANGLRNAIEAVQEFSRVKPAEIVINWGRGGAENWLVVMDTGAGFKGDPSAALKLGATNKKDHIGYGLATAQFAMRSMEGDVILTNNPDGGARFELRWCKDNENTFR
jgi:signal transduction histidine kinase